MFGQYNMLESKINEEKEGESKMPVIKTFYIAGITENENVFCWDCFKKILEEGDNRLQARYEILYHDQASGDNFDYMLYVCDRCNVVLL